MQANTGQQIVAAASRSQTRAAAFAARWHIGKAHAGYTGLLADPDVGIVYISTPHIEHRDCALAALPAGKQVLVEKP